VIDVDGSLQLVHDALRLRANQLSIRIQVRRFILSGAPPEAIRRLVEIGLKVKKRPQLPAAPYIAARAPPQLGQPTEAALPQAVTVPHVFDLKDGDRHDRHHHDRCGQCSHKRKHFKAATGGREMKPIPVYAKLSPLAGLRE
jgi:hypothetical protein